jgi:Bacterial Ig-like domain/Lamin Tail Domain/Secretion system C-terminal sorting domain
MRKIFPQLFLSILFLIGINISGNSQVVISQVYGGGGNSGSTYTHDFIELFNRGTTSVSLNGWSVQYASATGISWQKTDLTNVMLAPGQYYLIQEAQGAGGTTPLPTPDVTGIIAMSATAGKVVLLNVNVLIIAGTSCPTGATVQDIVGFGVTANCFEGVGPTPAPSNSNAVLRASNGCTDANNNAADFAAGAPNPRNTSTALNPCSGAISLTINDVSLNEGNIGTTSFIFTVSLSSPAGAGGVSFDIATANNTATIADNDYVAQSLTGQTIAAGNSTYMFTVVVNGDVNIEPNETFFVNVTNVVGATVTDGQGTGTILNDDFPPNPYISLVTTYTQDFNTLASTGTSSVVPTGWLFNETGTSANATYSAGTGSLGTGDTYSFGAAASTERAFGGLQSGALIPTIGAQIQNNSGSSITKLKFSYTGEQWRLGAESRIDKLSFQYSIDATSLTTGTWINVTNLDFIAPVTLTTGAKDGNAAANRTAVTYTLRNLSIPNGAVFLIRWTDFNATGADDGLAIDDFTIEANPIDITPPVIVSLSPLNAATNVPVNISASVQFNEDIMKGTGNIRIRRVSDNSIYQTINITSGAVTVSSATVNISLSILEVNTAYYVEIDNGAITDLDGNPFAGISGNAVWAFTTGINFYVANFQTCTSGLTDGFSQYSVTGTIVWACTTFGRDPAAPAGTAPFPSGVQINGFAGGTNVPNVDWLISPSFDLTGTTYPLLSFWSRTAFNGQPLQLKVSTDYVSGDPTTATWTDINGKFPSQTSNIWTLSENINLSAFKQSNVHFAFVYVSDDDEGARWTLDDVSLGNSPTPPPPSLTVSTSDIQFTYVASGSTADKTFTFIGNDLINNVTLNATGVFTISKDGITFGTSLLYTIPEANNLSKTVYVRFSPNINNQNFSGTITISTSSLSANVNLTGTSIDPLTTLEVLNWNIEWFGSPSLGPTNDALQQANVQTILQNIGADIYGLVEVVDESRLANVVANMPGYSYVISNYGSHTNTSANPPTALAAAQKLAFVYKNSVFSNVTTSALLSQGINSPADLTNPAYNYWASGRFPYMLSADVTLNCVTKNVKFILVHAKANTSPTATSYDRRKRGADSLHYTLQQNYANDNVIILGDYNDDLDFTITAGIIPPVTSYSAFINDAANFTPVTLPLSLAGKKSTISFNDVIDHVTVTDDLATYYLNNTANILTDVTSLVSNYGSTTSDHYPVFSRYRFNNTIAPTISSCTEQISFCTSISGSYTIPAFIAIDDCGDAIAYSYEIAGATIRNGSTNDASGNFNVGTSTIAWTATDSWGNSVNCETTVIVNPLPSVTIPDAFALPSGTLANTVYIGYNPASSITLSSNVSGGSSPYTYSWTSGSTSPSTTVSPTTNTNYTLTVTDANGCQQTAAKTVSVIDIRGGHNLDKVIICHNGNSLTVSGNSVPAHLAHGDMLSGCNIASRSITSEGSNEEDVNNKLDFKVLPNPSAGYFTILIRSGKTDEQIRMRITDITGRVVEQKQNLFVNQSFRIGSNYHRGIYFAEIIQGTEKLTLKLVKL